MLLIKIPHHKQVTTQLQAFKKGGEKWIRCTTNQRKSQKKNTHTHTQQSGVKDEQNRIGKLPESWAASLSISSFTTANGSFELKPKKSLSISDQNSDKNNPKSNHTRPNEKEKKKNCSRRKRKREVWYSIFGRHIIANLSMFTN